MFPKGSIENIISSCILFYLFIKLNYYISNGHEFLYQKRINEIKLLTKKEKQTLKGESHKQWNFSDKLFIFLVI